MVTGLMRPLRRPPLFRFRLAYAIPLPKGLAMTALLDCRTACASPGPRKTLVSLVSPRGATSGLDPDAACCAASCPHNAGAVHPTSPDVTRHPDNHATMFRPCARLAGLGPACWEYSQYVGVGTMYLRLTQGEDLALAPEGRAAGKAFPLTAHQQWQRG